MHVAQSAKLLLGGHLTSTPTQHSGSVTQPDVEADLEQISRLPESNSSTDARDWCKQSCGSKQVPVDEHVANKLKRAEQWLLQQRRRIVARPAESNSPNSWEEEKSCNAWLHGKNRRAPSDASLRASTLYDVYSLFEISLIANSDMAHLGSWHNAVGPSCRVLPARTCKAVLAEDYHAFLTEACILQLASHFYSSNPIPLPRFIGIGHVIKMLTCMSRLEDNVDRAEASSVLATILTAYVLAETPPKGSDLSMAEIAAVIHAGEKGSLRRMGGSLNSTESGFHLILDCGGLAIAKIEYGPEDEEVKVTLFGESHKNKNMMDVNFVLAASLGAKKSTARGLRLTKFTPELSLPPAEDDNFSETWGARLMALKRAFFVEGFKASDLLELDPTAGHRSTTGGADSVVDGRVGVAWDIVAGGVMSFAALAVLFLAISYIYIGIVLHYGDRVPVWGETLLSATSFLLVSELSFGFASLSRWFSRKQWSKPLFLAMWVASLNFGFKQSGRTVRNGIFVFAALGLNLGFFGGINLIYLLYFKLLVSLALSYLVCRWIVIILVFQKSVNCAQNLLKKATIAPEVEVFDQMSKLLQDRLCGTPVLKWGFTVASELAQLEPWFESTKFESHLHHAEAKDLGCGLVERTDVQRIIPFDIKTVLKNLIGEDTLGGELCDLTGIWGGSQVNRIRNRLAGNDGPDNLRQALRRPEREAIIGKHYKPYLLQFVSPEAQSRVTQSREAQLRKNEQNSLCCSRWSSPHYISQAEKSCQVVDSVKTAIDAVLVEYKLFHRLRNKKAQREALERCAINAESAIAAKYELAQLVKQVRDLAGLSIESKVTAPSDHLNSLEQGVKLSRKEKKNITIEVSSLSNFIETCTKRAREIKQKCAQYDSPNRQSEEDTKSGDSDTASDPDKIANELSGLLGTVTKICDLSLDVALGLHHYLPLRQVICLAKTMVEVKILPGRGHDMTEVNGAESCIRRKYVIFQCLNKSERISVRSKVDGPNAFELLFFLAMLSPGLYFFVNDSAPGFAVMHSMFAFVVHALGYDCVDCGHEDINRALCWRYRVVSCCEWSVARPAVIFSISSSILAIMALWRQIEFHNPRLLRKSRSVTLLLACIFHCMLLFFFVNYYRTTIERISDLRFHIKNLRSVSSSCDSIKGEDLPSGSNSGDSIKDSEPLLERLQPGEVEELGDQNSIYGIALMGKIAEVNCYRPHCGCDTPTESKIGKVNFC